jgi:uncharacterized protein (TIRG00374 family)
VLSAVFLFSSMRGVRVAEVLDALRAAKYLYILPAMAMVVLSFAVRSLRWQVILDPVKRVGAGNAFSSTMIGFMANNVLPMRAGEVVRAIVIARQERVSRSSALATIVVERVFDTGALLLTLLLGAVGFDLPPQIRSGIWIVAGTTGLSLLIFWVLAVRKRGIGDRIKSLPGGGSRVGQRVASLFESFRLGLLVLRSWPRVLLIVLLSGLVWVIFVFAYQLSFAAFDLHLSFRAPLFALGVVAIGIMLPSAPGYLGTMQYFFTFALATFGVEKSVAVSASWFFWAVQYFPVTVIGLAYFAKENLSLRQVFDTNTTPSPGTDVSSEAQTP